MTSRCRPSRPSSRPRSEPTKGSEIEQRSPGAIRGFFVLGTICAVRRRPDTHRREVGVFGKECWSRRGSAADEPHAHHALALGILDRARLARRIQCVGAACTAFARSHVQHDPATAQTGEIEPRAVDARAGDRRRRTGEQLAVVDARIARPGVVRKVRQDNRRERDCREKQEQPLVARAGARRVARATGRHAFACESAAGT